jgi:hypothetical protein
MGKVKIEFDLNGRNIELVLINIHENHDKEINDDTFMLEPRGDDTIVTKTRLKVSRISL